MLSDKRAAASGRTPALLRLPPVGSELGGDPLHLGARQHRRPAEGVGRPELLTERLHLLGQAPGGGKVAPERDQELGLAWAERGDEAALAALVDAHRRLAVAAAVKYRGYGLPLADLIQEGNLGLMQAAERFDPSRGVRFATYAIWWVRAAIQSYVLRNWSMVRLGTTTADKTLFFRLRRLSERVSGESREEMRRRIADDLQVDVEAVEAMANRLVAPDQSVNTPVTDDGFGEWQDLLVDDAPSPEEHVARHSDAAVRARWLKAALDTLPERERRIIEARHMREQAATLNELGADMGISKERVRQLERRAIGRLQHLAANDAAVEAGGTW